MADETTARRVDPTGNGIDYAGLSSENENEALQTDGLVCYVEALIANPGAMLLSVMILGAGYLLFGLDPTPERRRGG